MLLLRLPPFPSSSPRLASPPLNLPQRRRPSTAIRSFGGGRGGEPWKLPGIDTEVVQQRLSSWLLKAQSLLTDAAAPLVNPGTGRNPALERQLETIVGQDDLLMASELTVDHNTPNGYLSLPAVVSIEQFGRMNGLTGRKMQKIFKALAPEHVKNDARSLVEYCCFRYLSRDSSDFHPGLKELSIQRLIFVTMLAWEQPYSEDGDSQTLRENTSLQRRLVGEKAFVRIASAIAGVADVSTAHHLFKTLSGNESGISLSLWTTYIAELLKVHQGRMSYRTKDILSNEQVLCIGSSRKRPVLKWENNIAWPGNLTLTDRALYFEAIGLTGIKESIRLDLTKRASRVEKAKVGPFGSKLFDSAVSVSGPQSETWILEFVDFGGEMRRDVWHAFISEIISLYDFICEYGPADDDSSIHHVYGANRGKRRAISSAANSIARLQCLQFIHKLSEDPAKLVQFSCLGNVPYGDVVLQTLAVNFWGGPLITKFNQTENQPDQWVRPFEELSGVSTHVFDIDGSVYLRKWMRCSTWSSSSSIAFWKNSLSKQGIVLSKNLVVADLSLVERAALTCREKSRLVEKTQETIDAAMIQGIPSNIDLFKEIMLPIMVVAKKFDKLRHWEEPRWTISFLVVAYTIILRNLLPYVFPMTLMFMAIAMLLLKGLKEQGRLGRTFGKVTIRDQPPSNTIQKIIALKEAMADLESYLQNVNVSLLKIRTIFLSGQPEITTEVALVLLCAATVLLVVPFKYILAAFLLDLFTRELEFRREMVMKFMSFLKERWASVHAAPVVVLPYESDDAGSTKIATKQTDKSNSVKIDGNKSSSRS